MKIKNKIIIFLIIFVTISALLCSHTFAYEAQAENGINSIFMPDEVITIAKGLPEYSKVGNEYILVIFRDGWLGWRRLLYILFGSRYKNISIWAKFRSRVSFFKICRS